MVGFEYRIDHGPGGLNRVLTGEERSVADHRVAQESLVRRFLTCLLLDQRELSLVADEFPPGALDASGEAAILEPGESWNRR